MKNLYPNSSITVTSDHRFNILAYAAQTEDPVLIQEMEMEGLKKLYYYPPTSRRYGQGAVISEVSLGGWNVGWRDEEFKVVFTSVSTFSTERPSLITVVVRRVQPTQSLVLNLRQQGQSSRILPSGHFSPV
jgi:hypothetical protein